MLLAGFQAANRYESDQQQDCSENTKRIGIYCIHDGKAADQNHRYDRDRLHPAGNTAPLLPVADHRPEGITGKKAVVPAFR